MPDTRREFWAAKIAANRRRDLEVRRQLEAAGWRWCTVWECALRGPGRRTVDRVVDELVRWIGGTSPSREIAGEGADAGSPP